ncbi:peroxiredoxin-like [Poeciliopsis prolifica]|uniref:peroxiredoxin-like n=1 Tax=Poeciliopsis prolifica TaxID=188132 RepID=UPI0024146692|nr:peroxiredoxin-like [Poeciliopsis prolifica]
MKLCDDRGKHVVVFFYPLNFTFVSPAEVIGSVTEQKEDEGFVCRGLFVGTWRQITINDWSEGHSVDDPCIWGKPSSTQTDRFVLLAGGLGVTPSTPHGEEQSSKSPALLSRLFLRTALVFGLEVSL